MNKMGKPGCEGPEQKWDSISECRESLHYASLVLWCFYLRRSQAKRPILRRREPLFFSPCREHILENLCGDLSARSRPHLLLAVVSADDKRPPAGFRAMPSVVWRVGGGVVLVGVQMGLSSPDEEEEGISL